MNDSAELRRITEVERQAALDDLLSRWHWWRSNQGYGRGFRDCGNATSEYRSSRQYDDTNGALDDAIEANIMRQVDFEIDQLGDPWRSAVMALARSLCVGSAVFHSPRIKPEDRAQITAEARERLTTRLMAAGVM